MKNGWGEGDSGRKTKKRSKTAEKMQARKKFRSEELGFDAAPDGDGMDDFDLKDMVGSLKKQKPVIISLKKAEVPVEKKSLVSKDDSKPDAPSTAGTPAGAISLAQEKRDARILNIDPEKNSRQEATIVQPRMDGESKKAFQKRMQMESKRAIRNERMQDNRNPEKMKRKKEFMNAKKKAKKNKGRQDLDEDSRPPPDNDYDIDIMVTGERSTQQVAFGEQVQRPPTFQILPRGATAKRKMTGGKASNNGMSDAQRKAEHNAMEIMRLKVQAQYAIMKAKRRQDRDFHL